MSIRTNSSSTLSHWFRKWSRPFPLLIILLIQSAQAPLVPGQQTNSVAGPPEVTLELGKPIERELSGGQKHVYHLPLLEGQYVKLEVRQTGIDVGVRFLLPDGELTQPFQPFGGQPELTIGWVARLSGIYRIEVYTSAKAAAGHYEIKLAELRPSTENDHALQQARDLFIESGRLNREAKYAEAIPVLRQILAIRERVLGPDDLLIAETLGFLASDYEINGDYASAEPLRLRALKIFEKTLGPVHPRVARELAGLGNLYQNMGDYLKAEETDQRALGIYEAAQLAENPAAGSLLATLGDINYAKGDYDNAEKYYERSRAVWEKLLGPDHFHLAPSYSHLGRVAYDAGNYAKAEAMFQKALLLVEKGLGPDHIDLSKYLNDLATVYCTTGNYAKGEDLYRRALSNHEKKLAMGNPAVQETLFGLARCYAAQGEVGEALRFQSQASESEERYVSLNLTVGSEREKLAFLASLSPRLSRNISLHIDLAPSDPQARDLAMLSVLREKGRVQDTLSANFAALRSRLAVEDKKLLDVLNDVTTKLSKLVLTGAQGSSPAEHQRRIDELAQQREKLEAEISRRSANFYKSSEPMTLAAVQKTIPAAAALVELAVYRPFDPKAPDNQKAYGEARYVAYVIRDRGEVQSKELGNARDIDAAVDALRQALRDPQSKDVRQLARTVDEKIMRSVRALIGDATQLLISPDGPLNLIPFAALVDEQGRYLVERYSLTYLTSGRDLLRMQVARENKTGPIVIANPSFGETSTDLLARTNSTRKPGMRKRVRRSVTTGKDLSEVYFAPLIGTEQEAHSIQTLFPEASVLTGAQATESAVERVNAPRILHIATHGFFLSEPGGVASGLALQNGTGSINVSAKIENPLLRSGLAFAGANLHNGGANDDGILTALEASGLNLWGTKLVVLSACDTGVGEVRNGEGVYGLRRAFVIAGAESLVMSLWPISDYTTRQLMTNYYQNLKQGMGRGESLRQVQLDMLKKNPQLHPFYWANFIQSGDWTNLDGKR